MAKIKLNLKKLISIIVILVVVLNLFLFAFRVYSALIFWIIIILGAIIAYLMPRLKEKKK